MDHGSISTIAGIASTLIFASSMLPMLRKAARTRDLASYSFGNILLANVGNVVHSVYVFSLPPGPIWALHSFYLLSSALMLVWFLQSAPAGAARTYTEAPIRASRQIHAVPDAGCGTRS